MTQGVYDTVSGRTLVIPQGTRLIGRHEGESRHGDKRAFLIWDRLILPRSSYGPEIAQAQLQTTRSTAPQARLSGPTLLWDPARSLLRYDRDGSGPIASQVVAILEGKRKLPRQALQLGRGSLGHDRSGSAHQKSAQGEGSCRLGRSGRAHDSVTRPATCPVLERRCLLRRGSGRAADQRRESRGRCGQLLVLLR